MTRARHSTLINVSGLFKAFYTPSGGPFLVLKDLNFAIAEGEFVIIFGPSGCGKTTLLHTIIGLEDVTKGKILFNDHAISSLDEEKRASWRAANIGIIYQSQYWVRSMNVIQNVCLPLLIAGLDEGEAYRRGIAALREIGMGHAALVKPHTLSGGEQQRVGFARAIVNDPRIIVADEPTGNLDTDNADRVISLLRRYHRHQKKTVIMVTHNLSYLQYATHTIALRDGQLVSVTDEVKRETKNLQPA